MPGLGGLPLREELRGLEPYGAPQVDAPVRLDVNENPYPPSERVVDAVAAAVAQAVRSLNRYPDREARDLRRDLAAYLGRDTGLALDPAQVWVANGSNEVMLHVLQAFGGPGRTALSFAPTYSMYPEYARDTATAWVASQREPDFGIDPERALKAVAEHTPAVVLLASPNNPTGTALPLELVEAVCDASAGVVVVDEAYAEFRRDGTPSAVTLLPRFERLAVTRTMSKAFALAGARLGYLAASADLVDALRLVRLPYHLSAVTQAVARTALAHADELLARVAELRARRDETVTWLRAQGWTVADSDANFVLVGPFADRRAAWQGLLDEGVLVRAVGPPGRLRVTIGTEPEMAAFRSAMTGLAAAPDPSTRGTA